MKLGELYDLVINRFGYATFNNYKAILKDDLIRDFKGGILKGDFKKGFFKGILNAY